MHVHLYSHVQGGSRKIILINVNGDGGAKDAAEDFAKKHKLTMPHYYLDAVRDVNHYVQVFMYLYVIY